MISGDVGSDGVDAGGMVGSASVVLALGSVGRGGIDKAACLPVAPGVAAGGAGGTPMSMACLPSTVGTAGGGRSGAFFASVLTGVGGAGGGINVPGFKSVLGGNGGNTAPRFG